MLLNLYAYFYAFEPEARSNFERFRPHWFSIEQLKEIKGENIESVL